ncbi:MAG TPA: chemotaxis protein CheB [Steroidobacteraceae bacterium]|nr:chemotaxis protein CheB [Steroidobacteraceae bacterium]
MAHRDIIVIGTSLGGVEALPRLVAALPANLQAAVLVVMHLAPHAHSFLADRLDQVGPLRAAAAIDGEKLEHGRIYVPVVDHHLMIEGDRVRLTRGPRESHARPSVDVLFRSAAYFCGPRVVGVVLTGMLDDGTSGLWSIKDRGGVAIVQSPDEAPEPGMPRSALRHVEVDYTLRIDQMPDVLESLQHEEVPDPPPRTTRNSLLAVETRVALGENARDSGMAALGEQSFFTCPICQGSMIAVHDGSFRRFRCHTGHGFTPASLAEQSLEQVERSLFAAMAQLEEYEVLLHELEQDALANGRADAAARFRREAQGIRQLVLRTRELAIDPSLSPPADA